MEWKSKVENEDKRKERGKRREEKIKKSRKNHRGR